jgi:hypothetical protein
MKLKLALIGVVSLALAACDKKEEIAQSPKPDVTKKKIFSSEQRSTGFKPAALKPKPSAEPEIAQIPANEQQMTSPPMLSKPEPAIPPATLSATGKTTEELRVERLARMAKASEARTAQMTEQLTARFKEQDTNGDGFLAKDEMTGRMQRRFDEADKNRDGFLDATEQQTMIQASAQRASEGGGQRRGGQGGGSAGQGRGNRNP